MSDDILMAINMVNALIHFKAKEGDIPSIYLLSSLGEEERKFKKSKNFKDLKIYKKLIKDINETFTNALKDLKEIEVKDE